MPEYETPGPVSAAIDLAVGDLLISTGEAGSTSVDVEPTDPSEPDDRRAAEATRVECAGGHLRVKAPKLRTWASRRGGGSVTVAIRMPAGSELRGTTQMGDLRCEGSLGNCHLKTGLGDIRIAGAGAVTAKASAGDIAIEHATGDVEVATGSGEVRLRALDRDAVVKNSNGDTWVGTARGGLRIRAANGSIAVESAEGGLEARSANGAVRLGELRRGTAAVETGVGDVEVGIPEGVAAYLDVKAAAGRVRNALEAAGAPAETSEAVEVRARTSMGDIFIRRPVVS